MVLQGSLDDRLADFRLVLQKFKPEHGVRLQFGVFQIGQLLGLPEKVLGKL
jgi:hypothetical protein